MMKWLLAALAPALGYLAIAFIAMEMNPAQWADYDRFLLVRATGFSWLTIAAWDLL